MLSTRDGKPVVEIADHKGELRDYDVTPPRRDGEVVVIDLTHRGKGETSIVVLRGRIGSCTCPDYVYRRRKTGEPCKHIQHARSLMDELAAAVCLLSGGNNG
jgi:hypothetical protein